MASNVFFQSHSSYAIYYIQNVFRWPTHISASPPKWIFHFCIISSFKESAGKHIRIYHLLSFICHYHFDLFYLTFCWTYLGGSLALKCFSFHQRFSMFAQDCVFIMFMCNFLDLCVKWQCVFSGFKYTSQSTINISGRNVICQSLRMVQGSNPSIISLSHAHKPVQCNAAQVQDGCCSQ